MMDTRRGPVSPVPSKPFLTTLAAGLLAATVLVSPARAVVPTGFVDELVASGTSFPAGIAFLPDGRLLFTEQFNRTVRVVPVGSSTPTTLFTVSDAISGSERGLLGIAVDPDWPARPYLYFHFSVSGSRINIRMYEVSGDLSTPTSTNLSLANPFNILTDIPDNQFNHNGGTLRFGPDGMLYVSLGDDANQCNAQDLTVLAGKILRLDVSALPEAGTGPPDKSTITPAGNPFPGPPANVALVWNYGLRNPFRFSIDPQTGKLYIGDVGQNAWEEMDEASGGENFGWPHREGAHDFPTGCPGSDGIDPIWEYAHGGGPASIIAGPIYRGGGSLGFPAEYDGDVFAHDYYIGDVKRLTFNEGSGKWGIAPPVAGQPTATTWATGLLGAADVVTGPDGALYYADQNDGQIRRIAGPGPTDVGPVLSGPADARLSLRPNPWGGTQELAISFSLPAAAAARVDVFDIHGALVATVTDGRFEGTHTIGWNGRRSDGSRVPAGVYFVSLLADGAPAASRKVTLLP